MKTINPRFAAELDLLPVEEAKKLQIEWSEEWSKLEREDELNFIPNED